MLLKVILEFYNNAVKVINLGAPLVKIKELELDDEIVKLKSVIPNKESEKLNEYIYKIRDKFEELIRFYKG